MLEKYEVNLLVSNVVNECRFSHCRLCLRGIEKEYVTLKDFVEMDFLTDDAQLLPEFFGQVLSSESKAEGKIAGVDAVCLSCVENMLEMMTFIKMCKSSNDLLHNVFNGLTEALNVELDTTNNKAVYVFVEEHESKLHPVKKDNTDNENFNALKLRHERKTKQYECTKCDMLLDNLLEIKAHNFSFHYEITCDVCYESFSNELDLENHSVMAHRYGCDECGIRMDTDTELFSHIRKNHNVYVCKDCGVSCEGVDKLQIHERRHLFSKRSKCPKCGKLYTSKDFFERHVKLCLEDKLDPHPFRTEIVKTYICDLCGKGYSTPGGLRVHERFTHGNAKPHECEYCGKQFTAPSYLKTHMLKHTGEKNFKCTICNRRFVSKEALLYHTRRHTGEKPYSCKYCNERFVNASARAEHVKFKHVGPKLSCEICSRKFVTASFLKLHMNRHSDPTSKMYVSRTLPPNMPGDENKKIRFAILK
ncbi:zinc finger protein 433-like [Ostrinia nubilalis]|uniref:zinc finger protein 433-like n=1 Tax=Ostrinia nubilalis TaxID=29057 RepID=UPI0030825DBA